MYPALPVSRHPGTDQAATRASRQQTGSSQAGVMPTSTHGYQSQPFGNGDKAAHSKKICSYSKIVDIQLSWTRIQH